MEIHESETVGTVIFDSMSSMLKFTFEESLSDLSVGEQVEISEILLSSRLKKRKVLKNYRKSQLMKKNWRVNKAKLLRGIHKFHKSTKGKEFHRKLSRRIASRDFKTRTSLLETLVAINSLKAHLYIGCKYSSSMDEEVDYENFVEEAVFQVSDIETKILKFLEDSTEIKSKESILSDEDILFLSDIVDLSES